MQKQEIIIVAPLFNLGDLVMTEGVQHALEIGGLEYMDLQRVLNRHVSADWGDIPESDKELNDQALNGADRIFSGYKVRDEKLWVITEHDRSYTTVMFPSEY